eukprot:CAMPEP_0115520058 /NCGR_PEP_ID=MMETSP0271-20121206/78775_1 /TAXON_ID=71861 /ORGANISM="Scrippsiella trochoidea, Strain CCMP3099" /LENGTH=80 /DNA_ID=CAMNT_0002951127 /DNA_START=436 /DNA_END=675 /DNA_ORIENTATION=-
MKRRSLSLQRSFLEFQGDHPAEGSTTLRASISQNLRRFLLCASGLLAIAGFTLIVMATKRRRERHTRVIVPDSSPMVHAP